MRLNEDRSVEDIVTAFDNHFIGKINETHERYVFNRRDQQADETVDNIQDYIAALRTLSSTCNFCDCLKLKDTLLRDRIVLGIRDSSTRKRLLQEADLNLKTCIDIIMCRAAEATTHQLKNL